MTYKVRHKGKPKERFLPAGLTPMLAQILLIVAALITAIMMPRHKGKSDPVVFVALSVTAVGGVLTGLTRLAQAVLGGLARSPRGSAVVTFLYRAGFVLVTSGLIATFYRVVFR
jgi:hypothetical protein